MHQLPFVQRVLKQLGFIAPNEQHISAIAFKARSKVAIAAFVALFAVSYLSYSFLNTTSYIFLLASMGASAVILFALPNSPLARPWSFIAGHLIPACIGLWCAHHISSIPLMAGATIGMVIFAMYMFECMHPPGGATALVPVIAAASGPIPGWEFLVFPVTLNVLIMGFSAFLLRQFWLDSSTLTGPGLPHTQDKPPLRRLSLQDDDLTHALNSLNSVLDVSEQQLVELYSIAQQHALQRELGQQHDQGFSCGDLMSRDVITLSPEQDIATAWQLLRAHKVSMLPVVDNKAMLVGVVSLVDFLKDQHDSDGMRSLRHLHRLVPNALKPRRLHRTVATIMSQQVVSVQANASITTLVPLFAEQGLHHVPVLEQQRLVGVLTQSDFIAALVQPQVRTQLASTKV